LNICSIKRQFFYRQQGFLHSCFTILRHFLTPSISTTARLAHSDFWLNSVTISAVEKLNPSGVNNSKHLTFPSKLSHSPQTAIFLQSSNRPLY
jgi:hypothetical protein